MAVFGLVAWAVNGTLSSPASTQTASVTKAGGRTGTGSAVTDAKGRAGTTAAGHRPAAAGPAGRNGQGTAGKHGTSHRRGGPAHWPAPGSPAAGHHRAAAGGHRQHGQPGRLHPGACPVSDLALSLRQPHASYGRGAAPAFTAEVISTAPQPCAFSVGPASVALVIRAHRAPLWSSADCAAGPARTAVLTRGVPLLLHFRWDRRTASPGCRGTRRPARPGAYLATAVSGQVSSNSLIFVLRGRGIAVP